MSKDKTVEAEFFRLYGTINDMFLGSIAVGSKCKESKDQPIKTLKDAKRIGQKMVGKNANVIKVEKIKIPVFDVKHGGANCDFLYDESSFIETHMMAKDQIALIFHPKATSKKNKGKGFVFTSSSMAEEAAIECLRISKALRKVEKAKAAQAKAKGKK